MTEATTALTTPTATIGECDLLPEFQKAKAGVRVWIDAQQPAETRQGNLHRLAI